MEKQGEGVRIFFHNRSNLLSQNWKNLNNQRPTEQFCDSFCFLTLLINTGTRQIFYQNQPKNNIKEKNYNKKLYKRYLTIPFHAMVRITYFSKHLFFENIHDTGRANCLNQLFGILVETEMTFLNGWEISISFTHLEKFVYHKFGYFNFRDCIPGKRTVFLKIVLLPVSFSSEVL